jgi:hypothetical protein
MSLSFANAVVEGLRAYGVVVRLEPGYATRGNGQTSNYQGLSWHHTATGFGKAPRVLVNGRSDLPGPLCNSSGDSDGGITIIAANPANHAGASGGKNMGPLPVTKSFNKVMWGHEIVYPGTKPMTDAQYRSAVILGAVISKILRRPNADWCRGHRETSITGKWDPGYADGKTYDLNKMRREATALMSIGSLKPSPAPAPVPSSGSEYRVTSPLTRNDEIKKIQAKFNRVYPTYAATPLDVDGYYGNDSASAVREFQNRSKLLVDGVFGAVTRQKFGAL